MPTYDREHFDPPAPTAAVTLRNPTTEQTLGNVVLLLDTGADITLLPKSSVDQLGLTLDTGTQYEIAGFDGQSSFVEAVDLDMTFLEKVIRGKYLLTNEAIGILGRDVLNLFVVEFDGPEHEWAEKK